jgi:hypothetical protein
VRRTRRFTIGELLLGGDWACAHGDLAGLGEVATRLVARLRDPRLAPLAAACHCDATRWPQLKQLARQTANSLRG